MSNFTQAQMEKLVNGFGCHTESIYNPFGKWSTEYEQEMMTRTNEQRDILCTFVQRFNCEITGEDYYAHPDDLGYTCADEDRAWGGRQDNEDDFQTGDPRTCPHHPGQVISSPCGLFDGVCGECEALSDEADHEDEPLTEEEPKPAPIIPRRPLDESEIPF